MKTNHLLILLGSIVMFASIVAFLMYNSLTIVAAYDVPVLVNVNETLGLNADTNGLYFGKLRPSTSGERFLELSNDATYPLRVDLQSSGEVKDWIVFSQNPVRLLAKTNQSIKVSLIVPTVDYGKYSGSVHVIYRKA